MPKSVAEVLLEEALRRLRVDGRPPSRAALTSLRKLLEASIMVRNKAGGDYPHIQIQHHVGILADCSRGYDWRAWGEKVAMQTEGSYNRGHVLREIKRLAEGQP